MDFSEVYQNVKIYNIWDAEIWYVALFCGVTKSKCGDFENFHFSAILGGLKSDFWSKWPKLNFDPRTCSKMVNKILVVFVKIYHAIINVAPTIFPVSRKYILNVLMIFENPNIDTCPVIQISLFEVGALFWDTKLSKAKRYIIVFVHIRRLFFVY